MHRPSQLAIAIPLIAAACGSISSGGDAGVIDSGIDAADQGAGAFVWQIPLSTSFGQVDIDSNGNVFVGGSFTETIDLGGGALAAEGDDVFVARFDSDSNHIASASYGGPGSEFILSLDVDVQGSLVLFGVYDGAPNLGGTAFPAAPANALNSFIARYLPNGAHDFSLPITSATTNFIRGGGAGGGQSVVVAGGFDSVSTIGSQTMTPVAGQDAYLIRLDDGGSVSTAVTLGGPGGQAGAQALFDGLGSAFYVGHFDSAFDLGSTTLTPGGSRDVFVSKLTLQGAPQWSLQAGSTIAADEVASLAYAAVDDQNNLVVTGSFTGTMNFPNGTSLVSAGAEDVFLAKIDPSGTVLFAERFGGLGIDRPRSVAAGPGGVIGVIGEFSGTASFGGADLESEGDIDIFVVKLDSTAGHVWSRGFGAAGQDRGSRVAFDDDGSLIMTAAFQLTVDFGGPEPLTANRVGFNSVLLKFTP